MQCLLLIVAIAVSLVTVASGATLRHQAGPPGADVSRAGATELILTDVVSQHGITWQFTDKVRVGRFVNGDSYVVGPVTIAAITPGPRTGATARC